MAYSFRLTVASIPTNLTTKQYYFGVSWTENDRGAVVAALDGVDLKGPLKAIADRISDRDKAVHFTSKKRRGPASAWIEVYFADLGAWHPDIADYGVENLRAALVAAGFEDRSAVQ